MTYAISKITNNLGRERKQVKTFKTSQDMNAFLNKQYDNSWKEESLLKKSGTYAFLGGSWQNVKTIDKSILAHL